MIDKQKQLAKAIEIAVVVHHNQYDKAGKPYILHPLHLMNQLMWDPELAAIAVMHDVVEDSEVTLHYLAEEGFSERVLDALDCLTHLEDEDYDDYITRISYNLDAITVKRKDLQHNSDITRLKGVRPKDFKRIQKYHTAFRKLTVYRDKLRVLKS